MINYIMFGFETPKIEVFHAKKKLTKINYFDLQRCVIQQNHIVVESFTLCCIESNVHA